MRALSPHLAADVVAALLGSDRAINRAASQGTAHGTGRRTDDTAADDLRTDDRSGYTARDKPGGTL